MDPQWKTKTKKCSKRIFSVTTINAMIKGRIVFWDPLGPKINIWSIYHTYLSPRFKQNMKINMKDVVFY